MGISFGSGSFTCGLLGASRGSLGALVEGFKVSLCFKPKEPIEKEKQKRYKTNDSGWFPKQTKHIQPKTASGDKKIKRYKPEPMCCLFLKRFKSMQQIGSGLNLLHLLTPEAVSGCICFVCFRVPPESSILCMFVIFLYYSGTLLNRRCWTFFFVLFLVYPRDLPKCSTLCILNIF